MKQITGMTAELYKAVVAIVDERMREIRVTREDFNALRGVVSELAQAQRELAQAQVRTEERMGGLEQAMERLAQAQTRTEEALRRLAQQVGTLSESIGFGLEDIARVVLPGYLERHYGLKLEGPLGAELGRKFFDVEGLPVEINLYGEGQRDGQKVVILGEAKSRIHGREVERFARNLGLVEPLVKREVLRVMFGFYIHPTAVEAAKEANILLVASYQR